MEHRHQPGDKAQFEIKPGRRGKGHEFTVRIAGVARHFISPTSDSPSVPTRLEWGSPPSDGTSRAGWRQGMHHQTDWRKAEAEDQTALDAFSLAQAAVETGWDFSLPFPSHRLEEHLLGAPPLAAAGENLVACAPAHVPSDSLEQLLFVVSPRPQPMATGLYWYLHYRRGTIDLSQIIVVDQSGDQQLQNRLLKRSGEARPGESAPALIQRYLAGILRSTEADPAQAGK